MSLPTLKVYLLLIFISGLTSYGFATTVPVINSNDNGVGSLRQAVIDATAGDTIVFDVGTNGSLIELDSQIIINQDLIIIGNDSSLTVIDGKGVDRIFEISTGAVVNLQKMTIQNGGTVTQGGGIKNAGTLMLMDCKVQMNSLTSATLDVEGGGIYNSGILSIIASNVSYNTTEYNGSNNRRPEGGGIHNTGTTSKLTIKDSRIINNLASNIGNGSSRGGAIYMNSGTGDISTTLIAHNSAIAITNTSLGGGIEASGDSLTLDNVEISNNLSNSNDDSAQGGGILCSSIDVVIRNSKISGNEAKGYNGASGGGVIAGSGSLDIYNTVISGNKAHSTTVGFSFGVFGGGLRLDAGARLTNGTITGNEASNVNPSATVSGGGIFKAGSGLLLGLKNTIVAKNIGDSSGADIETSGGNVEDLGGNHVMASNGGHNITSGNDIDPLFVSDVPTAPTTNGDLNLMCLSIAVDGGMPDTTQPGVGLLDLDALPRVVGKHIDIGAYERSLGCHEIVVIDDGLEVSDSATIDLGVICESFIDTLYIKNTQAHFLIIDSIRMDSVGIDESQFELNVEQTTYPDTLCRGDSLRLVTTFTSTSGNADTAIIRIESNDPDESIYDIVLVASGDLNPPIVTCKDTTITLNTMGNASIDSSFVLTSFDDNCGIESVVLSKVSFGITDIGIQTVNVTVSDGTNSASCSAEVTISAPCSTVVSNTNDSGCGSLRFVASTASAGDTITFYPSINGDTIMLTSGQIQIDKDLVITGNGMDSIIIDGNAMDRIFEISSQKIVSIENLSIQNGGNVSRGGGIKNDGILKLIDCNLQNNKTDSTLISSQGGAISNSGDSLIIENCQITNNHATKDGGGIYSFKSSGTIVQIRNTTIANNTITPVGISGFRGGGIRNVGNSNMLIENSTISGNSIHTVGNQSAYGGGIYNNGVLTLVQCEVNQNETFSEEALSRGGGIYNIDGTVTIESSKINSNTASSNNLTVNANAHASGGGIYSLGESAELIILNSTIAGNTVNSLGGKGHGAGVFSLLAKGTFTNTVISGNFVNAPTSEGVGMYADRVPSYIQLINVTNTGNRASGTTATGGGLYAKNATIDIVNTIIANTGFNGLSADIRSISSTINDLGNNHIFSPDGGHGITTGNNIDPLFIMNVDTTGGIASISGDLRLACGSPSIDAGTLDTTGLDLGLIDIAGLPRIQGDTVDIGAHERAQPCTEYSDCSQDSITLDNTLFSISDPLSVFHAQTELQSDATITRDISTKAEVAIQFNKNFSVTQGVTLEAVIGPCQE